MAENQSKGPASSQVAATEGPKIKSVVLDDTIKPKQTERCDMVAIEARDLMKNYSLSRRPKPLFDHCVPEIDMHAVMGSTEDVYMFGNCSLFSSVLAAYNNHWTLHTCPDDWWWCVIRRVAIALDKTNDKESIKKFFVDHQEFKDIIVDVPDKTFETVKESWLMEKMFQGMKNRTKFPEFVEGMASDFSTTTIVSKFASKIALMFSVQEYFHFGGVYLCGIPVIEMLGTEEDWERLTTKMKEMRKLLEPVEKDLELPSGWWECVEKVFTELLATYRGNPDKKWWSHIINHQHEQESGLPEYRGWITEFLEGNTEAVDMSKMTTGLISLALELHKPSGMTDIATLVAGMVGFTLHRNDAGSISVKPFHGWCVMLRDDSPYLPKNSYKYDE